MGELIDERVMRARREARGWDQRTLAAAAGIDPSVVSRLERGLQIDLKVSVLVALARALELSVDSLLNLPQAEQHTMTPELAATVQEVARLAAWEQRQVALIVGGYLAGRVDGHADDPR